MAKVSNEKVQKLVSKASFWLAVLVSYSAVLLFMTRIWQLIIIPPAIAGLLFTKEKASLGWWSGFIGVALATLTILLYYVATQPAMQTVDLVMAIIIHSTGFGWVGFLLTIVAFACIGGFGGIIGFAIQALVQKREPGKQPESNETEP